MKTPDTFDWKKEYTVVLVLNIIYVLIFSYLMTAYT